MMSGSADQGLALLPQGCPKKLESPARGNSCPDGYKIELSERKPG
jgi:hypothetical protein